MKICGNRVIKAVATVSDTHRTHTGDPQVTVRCFTKKVTSSIDIPHAEI
jgi:hypothetical protein